MSHPPFCEVPAALEEMRAGRMVVVVDDEDRENEGDLTMAAEKVTPEAINFMARFGRGLICLSLTEERCDYLRLAPMTNANESPFGTAFTESIEAREGVTTGISAADRARTIRVAVDPASRPSDLVRPGHIFPLRARAGGVLVRAGQTEASVDLARMAGLNPSGVICEIMSDDGTMARVPELIEFCRQYNLKLITTAEVIRHRMATEHLVERQGEALVPTRYGEFRMIAYRSELDGHSHVAMVRGDIGSPDAASSAAVSNAAAPGHSPDDAPPALVRMHTHCLAGDVFGATWCECGSVLDQSLRRIAEEGRGAVIYLHQTSPGFTVEQLKGKPILQFHKDHALPTLPENQRTRQRDIGIGAQILADLNLRRIRLLTNHPRRVAALEGFDIEIVEHIPVRNSEPAK
jgi:3,4-dihydroxy 2-butanone 4-phosphate synthase/GTP cyclohydrolase II